MAASCFLPHVDDSAFSLANLPYGVYSRAEQPRRPCVRVGDAVLDLCGLERHGLLRSWDGEMLFDTPTLNRFMEAGRDAWADVRRQLQRLLDVDAPTLQDAPNLLAEVLHPLSKVTLHTPMSVGDYTDFYASRQHATNVGTLFRGAENALPPNWLHLPIGYHGRASSIVVSGTPVRRPLGQRRLQDAIAPEFGPSQELDLEVELGAVMGVGNRLGNPIAVDEAEAHIFGYVLVNDWSARDLQRWEYKPLGPFLGKNFATTISPWVVPAAALDAFWVPLAPQDPHPLPYLAQTERFGLDIDLQVDLVPENNAASSIIETNAQHLYWTFAQMVAHHTVNGCNLQPGDLLASGTISGSAPQSYGSLLERSAGGAHALTLPSGITRTFLEDGDTVILRGEARRGSLRIGFGEAVGQVLPAR
ncbi:MAG: fumarylacetoacetase [Rhodothermales bacterium]